MDRGCSHAKKRQVLHPINVIGRKSKSFFVNEATMKRARSLDEDEALVVPQKSVDEASTFVVGLLCLGSERVVFHSC
jgi:hypothetical protein